MKDRLLIIHEEQTVCKNMKIYFNIKGYDVEATTNTSEGIRLIEDFEPHLLLLQVFYAYEMAMLKVAKSIKPDLKIIAMIDGGTEDYTGKECLKTGACKIISVPTVMDEFQKTLAELKLK